ncbi:uncharacterized protein [Aristolochia californica]|uniref:uncharacterized protein isoform X2 n=1 Tax=Aristolochia californica TaxID=171875 RepID=UPI0035DCE2FD
MKKKYLKNDRVRPRPSSWRDCPLPLLPDVSSGIWLADEFCVFFQCLLKKEWRLPFYCYCIRSEATVRQSEYGSEFDTFRQFAICRSSVLTLISVATISLLAMEASLRLSGTSTHLNRRVPITLFRGSLRTAPHLSNASNHIPTVHLFSSPIGIYCPSIPCPSAFLDVSRSSSSFPKSNLLGFPLSLSATHISPSCSADGYSDFSVSKSEEGLFKPAGRPRFDDLGDQGLSAAKNPIFTTVLLGWLGAETKHLRRGVERRIAELAEELISWLSEKEKDGRERGLLFHTFSNTGWLAYGALLDNLQQKGDFMQNIKGCIIDSGGDPEINPQVWAAGFSAALLKKGSPLKHSDTSPADNKTWVEKLLLNILKILFSNLLMLPHVNRRLRRIVNILSNQQPPCPQLFFYSTADKVIPFRSIELFIAQQKNSGKEVVAYNFDSSPHVDHLRSFPGIYSTKISEFLIKCISTADMTK